MIVDNTEVKIIVSFGVADYPHGQEMVKAIQNADNLMYAHKRERKQT
jgi:PleD family two-component response regulator